MKKYVSSIKILINEIFFGVLSFLIAVSVLTLWRRIAPEYKIRPEFEIYYLSLLFHVVEVIIITFIVRNIMTKVPDVFEEPYPKDTNLLSATVLLLVDWEKLNRVMKGHKESHHDP